MEIVRVVERRRERKRMTLTYEIERISLRVRMKLVFFSNDLIFLFSVLT